MIQKMYMMSYIGMVAIMGWGHVSAARTPASILQKRATTKAAVTAEHLTNEACRYILKKHIPDASVSYQEGASPSGKTVVPADLTPPIDYHLGRDVTIDLEVPLDSYGQWDVLRRGTGIEVGKMRVDAKGDVYINDILVNAQELSDLQLECRERLKIHTQDMAIRS